MSRNIRYTSIAEQDLLDAWLYTNKHYGEVKADSYIDAIKARINRLKSDYVSGVFDEEIGEDIQRINAQKHVIYYRVSNDTIEIHSILGPGQDKYQRFGTS